ncbi:MAG: chemotaxis protein CheD [Myxococcota bacterium]|nr:chemotaxis protein CheD [Myxococcales bacterium]
MNATILGVGELGATATAGTSIRTYALGSCVGVVVLHPGKRAVGMAHIALADSSTNAAKAKTAPGYFADTGVEALLDAMTALGCPPRGKGLVVKLAGGAKILDLADSFDIGKKNLLAVKKALWKFGLAPRSEDVGGTISRTLEVCVDSGRVTVTSATRETWEI